MTPQAPQVYIILGVLLVWVSFVIAMVTWLIVSVVDLIAGGPSALNLLGIAVPLLAALGVWLRIRS